MTPPPIAPHRRTRAAFLAFMLILLLSGTAAADGWNVTWTPISESIINKEYLIEVQNLQSVKRDVNISSFFDETNFPIHEMRDIEFYERKLLSYSYTIDHYDLFNHSEWNATNETWHNWTERIFYYTETVESEKLDWKKCKSQLFTSTAHTVKDNYRLTNIPKLGSKDSGDGTYNGTKRFLLKFKTPITDMESGYGSSGKVAVLLDDVEYHPYWNTSWSTQKNIILTGGASDAQTDYQILLNITYESEMQSDFDDVRFTNDTHELDAWLKLKVDGSYALVWVNFTTTPANGVTQDYYIYYGNAGAASDWDGNATFIEFDDITAESPEPWTEVDSPGRIVIDRSVDERIEATGLRRDEDAYMYQSKATDSSVVYAKININTIGDNDCLSGIVGISDTLDDAYAWQNGVVAQTYNNGGQLTIRVVGYSSGTPDYGTLININLDTNYWIKVVIDSTTATLYVYSDETLDTLVGSHGVTIGDVSYSYIYGAVSSNTAAAYASGLYYVDDIRICKYAANPPTATFGVEAHYAGSIHYNTSSPYNHTIESDGTITTNRSITTADDINWTAAAVSADCQLLVTEYNLANTTIANFTLYTASLDWLKATNLTIGETYNLTNSTTYEQQTADASGEANFTTDLIPGDYQILHDPPLASITGLTNSTGNFYHNWTWTNPTDVDFNYTTIYINGSHITNTSNEYYNLTADAHNQSTISTHTVDTTGNMNSTWVNHTSIIPNNPITITNTSDWSGDAGENVYVDYDATDADSDTPTFSCNRTDLFTDFSTTTGKGNWTATAGTYYVDFGVSDGYGSTSNYTMTITVNMTVILLSQTPSEIFQNTTGFFNQTWGISHCPTAGLNNTSVSFIFSIYDVILGTHNHSIRPPTNDEAAYFDAIGEQILRAVNRNETLNFENNATITGGNIYEWGGFDENSTEMTIEPINSTYTKVYINDSIQTIACSHSWYLDRSALTDATKTPYAIDKSQYALIKGWDLEAIKGVDHSIVLNIDTSLGALTPLDATPLNIFYLNESYDPLGAVDPTDSPYAFFVTNLNATEWIDHVYSPSDNASYIGNIVINSSVVEAAGITITNTFYIYLESNTPSSKPFYINTTNEASGTNVSFADTGVMWTGTTAPFAAHSYTPNIFTSFLRAYHQLQTKLYVANTDGVWGNSTLETTNIEVSQYPPTKPSIDHFHYDGTDDSEMNHTYSGIVVVHIGVSTDPDYGDVNVSHNLTLHYANKSLVAIINDTFNNSHVEPGEVFAHIDFNTTPYYSNTEKYTLKVIATDDEGDTATTWLGVNFSLAMSYLPPTPTNLQNTTGNFWVNHSWQAVAMDGHLISGEADGNFNGYNLADSTWNPDTASISGLGNGEYSSAPTIFQNNSTWYLIAGEHDGVFNGYNWTGSTWQTDTAIISGLGDIGSDSTPAIFERDTIWYLIAGETDGNFNGYNWTGSTWQTDTAIISGLGDVGSDSTPAIFDMDTLPDYNVSADSYNVSVNGVWHNNTPAYYNDTYTAHAWQNITVFAYNNSAAGTLSTISITQNTQIPNNDPSAGSPSPFNGATGVGTTPTLQVTITDADTDTMSVRFYEQGGSQIGSTQTNIPSGSAASVVWSGRSQSTTYYWYVITNDTYSEVTSTVWHFTTESGAAPTHEVTIEDCNNRQITEGGEIYNDFNYTNDDPDVPTFTTNATEGTLNSSTGIYNWTTSVGDNGTYVWWFKAQNAYGNSDTCTVTFTVSVFGTPATPTDLTHTKGDTWVNHTWNGGAHTDSFNVSINSTWHNGTTNEYYNNTGLSTDSWSNIIVWAYNSSEGLLSVSSVSENVQITAAEEERERPTTIPTSIFIAITVLMMCMTIYTLHTKGYVQKIFGGMITTMMAFMLSQQIVSGNVVHNTTLLKSTDTFVTESVEIIIPELAYLLLFIAVIMSLITAIFVIKYVLYLYNMSQKKTGGAAE